MDDADKAVAKAIYPLRLNPHTKEPYLQLPSPHAHIILTPPRDADADAIPPIMNDPAVYLNVLSPPYPYLREHAVEWVGLMKPRSDEVMSELLSFGGDHTKLVDGCPVNSIRDVKEDGSDVFIGDITVFRDRYFHIEDAEEKAGLIAENNARPLGDPELVWTFGDYLAPSHHSRGIMTAAVRTLIAYWLVPRMGAKQIRVTARVGNGASVRVFEKCGFTLAQTTRPFVVMPESKGGEVLASHVLEWKAAEK